MLSIGLLSRPRSAATSSANPQYQLSAPSATPSSTANVEPADAPASLGSAAGKEIVQSTIVQRIERRGNDRSLERSSGLHLVGQRELEPRSNAEPDAARTDHDQDRRSHESEHEPNGAALQQPADPGETDRRIDEVDAGDRRRRQQADNDRTSAADDGAHDQQRDRTHLCRQQERDGVGGREVRHLVTTVRGLRLERRTADANRAAATIPDSIEA